MMAERGGFEPPDGFEPVNGLAIQESPSDVEFQ